MTLQTKHVCSTHHGYMFFSESVFLADVVVEMLLRAATQFTEDALELVTNMRLQMLCEDSAKMERLRAHLALVRLLARVNTLMFDQLARIAKPLSAHVTARRLLVYALHVTLERRRRDAELATKVALVFRVVATLVAVRLERGDIVEELLTLTTVNPVGDDQLRRASLVTHLMICNLLELEESHPTQTTLELGFLRVGRFGMHESQVLVE